jgi:hypothetical protein
MDKPHFRVVMHSVSPEELDLGRSEHILKGAGPLKQRTALTLHNVMQKVSSILHSMLVLKSFL